MKQIISSLVLLSGLLMADFVRNGNVVTDYDTKLQWQDNTVGTQTNWQGAIDRCESLVLDGFNDWRLPNIRELKSIADRSRANPAINPIFVNTATTNYYWSSTTMYGTNTPLPAWGVIFDYGVDAWWSTGDSYYVRCVRSF